MPKSRLPYPPGFRRQMVGLVRTGRTPEELAREFEPTAQAIRNWVAQAERDEGRHGDGLSSAKREDLAACFSRLGGVFLTEPSTLAGRLRRVKGLVFDWDGVFNHGEKGAAARSGPFSEPDSMGTNILRYALWRRDREVPATAIITGEHNEDARSFAVRERFHAVYPDIKDKSEAMEHFRACHGLERAQIACVFDDINDLSMVKGCGVGVLVRRDASPLLRDYVVRNRLCDYVTGTGAGRGAVREAAELLVGLMDAFDAVVDSRIAFDADYARYLSARRAVEPQVFGRSGRPVS